MQDPTNSSPMSDEDMESFLHGDNGTDDVFASAFANASRALERQDAVDVAVKTAANSISIIGPILSTLSAQGATPEYSTSMMTKVLQRAQADASHVIAAYQLKPGEAPAWLSATVVGQIVDLITHSLENGNTALLEKPSLDYLQPLLATIEKTNGIAAVQPKMSSPHSELTNALMLATCAVMAEYQCFNYFHTNPRVIASEVSAHLSDRVVDRTLSNLTARFGLTENEQALMGTALLSQAGAMLAKQWSASIQDTINDMRAMPEEERQRTALTGYPLDRIVESFEQAYQGIEISVENAFRTLNPTRERQGASASAQQGPSQS
ncbi:hypothetical protein [Pseudomonas sp. EMN2]|uniref:hypothetical protein n=1 Tax=Pseudomonas sp. EMN2 TaxID=2615212 RepID=UPI00129ACE82|nr:hypothetical protein [Pseudomonas sp. EMN2]